MGPRIAPKKASRSALGAHDLCASHFLLPSGLEFGIEQQAAAEVGRDGGPIQNPSGYPLAGGKKSPILGASE